MPKYDIENKLDNHRDFSQSLKNAYEYEIEDRHGFTTDHPFSRKSKKKKKHKKPMDKVHKSFFEMLKAFGTKKNSERTTWVDGIAQAPRQQQAPRPNPQRPQAQQGSSRPLSRPADTPARPAQHERTIPLPPRPLAPNQQRLEGGSASKSGVKVTHIPAEVAAPAPRQQVDMGGVANRDDVRRFSTRARRSNSRPNRQSSDLIRRGEEGAIGRAIRTARASSPSATAAALGAAKHRGYTQKVNPETGMASTVRSRTATDAYRQRRLLQRQRRAALRHGTTIAPEVQARQGTALTPETARQMNSGRLDAAHRGAGLPMNAPRGAETGTQTNFKPKPGFYGRDTSEPVTPEIDKTYDQANEATHDWAHKEDPRLVKQWIRKNPARAMVVFQNPRTATARKYFQIANQFANKAGVRPDVFNGQMHLVEPDAQGRPTLSMRGFPDHIAGQVGTSPQEPWFRNTLSEAHHAKRSAAEAGEHALVREGQAARKRLENPEYVAGAEDAKKRSDERHISHLSGEIERTKRAITNKKRQISRSNKKTETNKSLAADNALMKAFGL